MAESSISVIVVDDEIELANLFKEYIQTCSLNAISFTDSLLALEYLKDNSKKFSLLMTDLRMPKMSGIGLATEVRKINENIKIILITAFMTEDLIDDVRFKSARIDQVVQKPVKFAALKESLRQLLTQPLAT